MAIPLGRKHMKTPWRPVVIYGNFMECKTGTSRMQDRVTRHHILLAMDSTQTDTRRDRVDTALRI